MRFTTIAALAVLTGAVAIGSTPMVQAQPAPPLGGHGPTMGPARPGPMGPRPFAPMYRPDDRKLTPPEVQKIAEGFLLWFGNRAWKVTDVHPGADGKIDFAFATADGSVIARFAMDTRNGRVTRTG